MPARNAAASSSESSASSASSLQSIPSGPLTIAINGFVVSGSSFGRKLTRPLGQRLARLQVREHLTEDLGLLANSGIAGLRLFLDSFQALRDVVGVRNEQLELECSRSSPGSPRPKSRPRPQGAHRPGEDPPGERAGAGNVLDPNGGGRHLPCSDERRKSVEPVVRDRGHADVRLVGDGCVGGDLRSGLRERVEESGLPRVGEPDDSDLERHGGEGYPATVRPREGIA